MSSVRNDMLETCKFARKSTLNSPKIFAKAYVNLSTSDTFLYGMTTYNSYKAAVTMKRRVKASRGLGSNIPWINLLAVAWYERQASREVAVCMLSGRITGGSMMGTASDSAARRADCIARLCC